MKVYDITQVYGVYDKQPVSGKAVRKTAAVQKSDKLSLSRDALDFQAVMKGLKAVPDVRADKVAELGAKYASGEYRADAKDIAEGLFRSGHFRQL